MQIKRTLTGIIAGAMILLAPKSNVLADDDFFSNLPLDEQFSKEDEQTKKLIKLLKKYGLSKTRCTELLCEESLDDYKKTKRIKLQTPHFYTPQTIGAMMIKRDKLLPEDYQTLSNYFQDETEEASFCVDVSCSSREYARRINVDGEEYELLLSEYLSESGKERTLLTITSCNVPGSNEIYCNPKRRFAYGDLRNDILCLDYYSDDKVPGICGPKELQTRRYSLLLDKLLVSTIDVSNPYDLPTMQKTKNNDSMPKKPESQIIHATTPNTTSQSYKPFQRSCLGIKLSE